MIAWEAEVWRFFESVMAVLGHEGWEIVWGETYCWRDKKLIEIWSTESEFECKQLLLHEIAHIDVVPEGGNQHTQELFDRQEELSQRFMGTSLSPGQTKFMAFYV